MEGERHLVKLSRYFDNEQFWTVPGERDGNANTAARLGLPVAEPEPDEYELYDLTTDPLEQRNLAHPTYATDASHASATRDAQAARGPARVEAGSSRRRVRYRDIGRRAAS